MPTYRVGNTIDGLGGRCAASDGSGWEQDAASLDDAIAQADELTAGGYCGYVRRVEDGAVLAPDGTWIDDQGQPVQ